VLCKKCEEKRKYRNKELLQVILLVVSGCSVFLLGLVSGAASVYASQGAYKYAYINALLMSVVLIGVLYPLLCIDWDFLNKKSAKKRVLEKWVK
jgi:hypothetical protein